jgi:putative protease
MKKPELLLPAGNLNTLKTAVRYGADAVYIGGEAFSLRAKADNFDDEKMREAVRFCHERGKKLYVAVNIFAHNRDLAGIEAYLGKLGSFGPDAIIAADPGVFSMIRRVLPDMDIHVSTQMNSTNYEDYRFWYGLGAKRVVGARELSLEELSEIRARIPEDREIEAFVHGAMCISYSGRCLLSNYFTGRDANRGACTHPCRWKYSVMEESRPGEYLPVYENERGTYIFNSRDLCMIEHIPELIRAGIDSFKIEGRMKTALYAAATARTYRCAIDDYMKDPELYRSRIPWYREEIRKCTWREFTTGFFFGKPDSSAQIYESNTYHRSWTYLGRVDAVDDRGRACFTQKHRFFAGDRLEIMKKDGANVPADVLAIEGRDGLPVMSAPHPQEPLKVLLDPAPEPGDILRTETPDAE